VSVDRETSILIVDDDPAQRAMLREVLAREAGELLAASTGEEALALLEERSCDLILLDMRMPGLGGLGTLAELGRREPRIPTVVMTAFADVEDAVHAMKLGATDYLRKPIDLATLTAIIRRHLGEPPAAAEPAAPALPAGLVFESPLMRDLLGELERVAQSDVPVLLVGETGTGKEVLAELVHRWGTRRSKPIVRVNVSALPEGLVESELFGHTKGAFTGADGDRAGRIEEAAGGTLFLDEIGEMPPATQPKLLRVLESGHVARLGAGAETRVDFRLVSATNRDLESAVGAGRFRQDLYYRVAVIVIEVPPLRERPEDILPLAQGVLRTQGDEPKILSPAAEALLTAHTWPGNIRELRNAMLRAAILAPGDRILPDHLPPNVRAAEIRSTPAGSPSPRSLAEIEREAILAALERCGGNRSQAARDLGISRRKLLYRLKEYGGGA
jgi:DNA-binding NtrC family response regulator